MSEPRPATSRSEQIDETGVLGYRQLIWRRFRKNRMGVSAAVILIFCYAVALGADFIAPYHYNDVDILVRHVPPQSLHFSMEYGLYVYGLAAATNPVTLESEFTSNQDQIFSVDFLFMDPSGGYHLRGSEGPLGTFPFVLRRRL